MLISPCNDNLKAFIQTRTIPGPSGVDAGPAAGLERVAPVGQLLALDREVSQSVQLLSINTAWQAGTPSSSSWDTQQSWQDAWGGRSL